MNPVAHIGREPIANLSAQLDGEIRELAGMIEARAMVKAIEK